MRNKAAIPGHHCAGNPGPALDAQLVLEEVGLKSGQTLLDAGCGEGRFSLPGAALVGEKGKVYAVDTSEERIASLRRAAQDRGLVQIEAFVTDVTERIALPAGSVDLCLMANVFHDLVENGAVKGELTEIRRVIKLGGVLAIVDFKKDVQRPPGPPLSRRLSPDEVERVLNQCGWRRERVSEAGLYHYLIVFTMYDAAP